jgi:hypothetical protein
VKLLLLIMLLAAPLHAGLWDRDRPESDRLPDAFQAATGRFDRLPTQHYQRRFERIEPLLPQHIQAENAALSDALRDFDDAAVARFRAGQYAEAIILIDRKAPLVTRMTTDHAAGARLHRLRGNANKAAFLMQRWLDTTPADQSDLRLARQLLRETLERDPYEPDASSALAEVEWLLSNPRWVQGADPIFPNLLELHDAGFIGERGAQALARNGLTGCLTWLTRRIVYEGGWLDVDVMYAFSLALALNNQIEEGLFAYFRVCELVDAGRKTRVANAPVARALKRVMGVHLQDAPDREAAEQLYTELRKLADVWVESRNEYALQQLAAGRHPDVDPGFWAGWRPNDPEPQPGVVLPDDGPIVSTPLLIGGIGGLLIVMLLMLVATLMLGRKASPHPSVDEV